LPHNTSRKRKQQSKWKERKQLKKTWKKHIKKLHHAFYSFIFEPDQATRWEQTQEILGQFMQQRFLGNTRMPHWPFALLGLGLIVLHSS